MITRESYYRIKGTPTKMPCIVASTIDINLSAATNIVDGILLNINDRVLVKDQILSEFNGIYTILDPGSGSDGLWERSIDFSISQDVFTGLDIYVFSGSTNKNNYFVLDTPNIIELNVTPLTFTVRSSGTGGAGTSGSSGSSGTSGVGISGTDGTSGTNGTSGSSGTSGVGISGTDGTSGSSGTNGTSGSSGSSGINGTSGSSGINGTSGSSGINGTSGSSGSSGINGTSGSSGINGTSGSSGINGTSGSSGTNGTSGSSGSSGINGTSGSSGINGSSGSSGINGTSGSSGINGTSGSSGSSGINGTSGSSGINGSSGSSGTNGTSGSSGSSGTNGTSGSSGSSGTNGTSGSSGSSGINGTSGSSGINGTSGSSGTNGTSGSSGTNGTSGSSGTNGTSGSSGSSGTNGTSGSSGTNGTSGSSGTNGTSGSSGSSGTNGTSGSSGSSGTDGTSGSSGTSGVGISGTDGTSGSSGTSGVGISGTDGTSGSSGVNGTSGSSGTDGFSTTGTTTGDFLIWSGTTWISQPGIIGQPYNTYSDGLFTDWTSNTPIGTSIDLINEVLKGLAPPPAPTLTSTSTAVGGTVQSTNGKISFGTDNMISGYWYSGYTVGTTYYLSAGNGAITGTLANNTSAHAYSYPINSFNNAGTITVSNIYSGTTYSHSVNLSSLATGSTYVATVSGITLTISAASYCKFSDGVTPFTQFTYRTGTWSIASTNLNNGFNFVQVTYQSNSIGVNNFIVDKDATLTTISGATLTGLTMTGSKYLSGVRYHTGGTALYSATINNAYKNTYYNAGTISFTTTNSTMVSTTIPNVTGAGADITTIPITNRTATITATRLLNQSIDAKIATVQRTLSRNSTPTNTTQTISGILMDNVTDASTNTLDLFDGESFRLQNNTYTTWSDITGTTNAWDSTHNLTGVTGLQVYGGTLVYPSINFSTITYAYSGNPNYTGLSGAKTYIRKFYLGLGVSNMVLVISGSGTGTIKASSDSTGNYIWIEAKSGANPGPTLTGWKDCYTTVAGGGCYGSTYGASRTFGGNWGLTFGTDGTAYSNGYVIIRVTTNAAITATQIQLTAF